MNQRAKGMVLISFPAPLSLKKDMKQLAEDEGESLSLWMRTQLRNRVRKSQAAKKGKVPRV